MTGLHTPPSYEAFLPELGVAPEDGQRELVRVGLDGRAPRPVDPDWRSPVLGDFGDIFGFRGPAPISALRTLAGVIGVRSGKSMLLGAGHAVYSAANAVVPKEELGPKEELYCSFLAPKEEKAIETMGYALGFILNNEALKARIVGRVPTSNRVEHFFFEAIGGGTIKFTAVAAGAGNIGGAGRWHLNCCIDEYGLLKTGTYKVNDKSLYEGVRNRLWRRAGDRFGRIQLIGSPWAREGHLWDLCEANYWNPVECVVAQAATDVIRTDRYILEGMLEYAAICRANGTYDVFERDYGARFLALGSVRIYTDEAIKLCPRSKRGELRRGDVLVVGVDLGFSYDHAAIVVWRIRWEWRDVLGGDGKPLVGRDGKPLRERVKTYAVVDYDEVEPEQGVVPRPGLISRRFAAVMRRYGAAYAMADQHYLLTLQEELDRTGEDEEGRPLGRIALARAPQDAILPHMRLAQLMAERRVTLLDDKRLLHQLTLPQRRPTGAKTWALVMPRGQGQGHADVAQAAAVGAYQADGTEVPEPPPEPGSDAWLAHQDDLAVRAEEEEAMGWEAA